MYQMTEPCTKIKNHGLQSLFLSSGRVVTQSERFIGLGEIPVDPKTDPSSYNEAVQDKDATLWQSAMKTELESMYSN